MPLKRSRPLTEAKFQTAVIDLIAESGCGIIGINVVAQRAGADKVLIYRYFGNLDGLWQRVAGSRAWLPESAHLIAQIQNLSDANDALRRITHETAYWFRQEPAAKNLMAWRKAIRNPLTDHFNAQWRALWAELAEQIAAGLEFEQRRLWANACELAALIVEAEVCDAAVDSHCIETLSAGLEFSGDIGLNTASDTEDSLPTNLL